MLRQRSTLPTLLAAFLLIATAMTMACDGDGGDGEGAPSRPIVNPGSGSTPVQAIGSYIDDGRLDGLELDISQEAECIAGVTPVPNVVATLFLGQFCVNITELDPEQSATVLLLLPETDESWQMSLLYDRGQELWRVDDVQKTDEG